MKSRGNPIKPEKICIGIYDIILFFWRVSLMLLIFIILNSSTLFAVIENSLAESAARMDASEGMSLIPFAESLQLKQL